METKKFLDGEGLKTLWEEIAALQSDYNETDETSPNFIKNKPFTINAIPEEIDNLIPFTTSDKIDNSTKLPSMQYVPMFSDLIIGQKMNLQFTYPILLGSDGQPQLDENGNVMTKTVQYEDIEIGNFADAMGDQFFDSPAIMMGPISLIATLPASIQAVAIPNDDLVFVYSNATLANGARTPLLIAGLMIPNTTLFSSYVGTCSVAEFVPENISLEGPRETHLAFQSDWDEQDKENVRYIQNKPFGREVIETPVGEIYADSITILGEDDNTLAVSMGIINHSLQSEIGKTYLAYMTAMDGSVAEDPIPFTCVGNEVEGIDNLPEGSHFLGIFDTNGQLASLFFIIDNMIIEEDGSFVYSDSHAITVWMPELYNLKILGLPEDATYDRIINHKVANKFLYLDQKFNGESENAQSGIAVNEGITNAINDLIKSLPSPLTASIYASSSLGDQHIKIARTVNDTKYPITQTYDLYTEGIGFNKDLHTKKKDTLVNAINELSDNQRQSDWSQEDSTQLDYIKNKPITAKYVTNYLVENKSLPVAHQMGESAFTSEDQFIDLTVGKKYDIDITITSTVDNTTTVHTFQEVECVDMRAFWNMQQVCPGIVIAPELMLMLYPELSYATLSDGLVFMYTNNVNGTLQYDLTKCMLAAGEIDQMGIANTQITMKVSVSQECVEGQVTGPYAQLLQADWAEQDETRVGYIKNKPSTGDYYFFNLKDFADIGYATKQYAHAVRNPSSGVYNDYFAINVVLGLGGIKGQTYHNITNIPYETLYINDCPYITDKHRFKNMGFKSPVFKQLLNYDGIVWFDAVEDCLRDILTDNFSSLYTITRQYSDMMIGFVIYGEAKRSSAATMNPKVQQAIGLWDAVLNDPDTQIVIEYQNSQNVQHIEGQLVMSVAELEEVE